MHDALKRLLKEALPLMVGGSVMVSDEALENGGGDRFMAEIRRKLADIIARFLVDNKVLDGADESCFSMRPHPDLAATECTARLHVLTPKELEALMQKAFDAGRSETPKGYDRVRLGGGVPSWLREQYEPIPLPSPPPIPPELRALLQEAYLKKMKKESP